MEIQSGQKLYKNQEARKITWSALETQFGTGEVVLYNQAWTPEINHILYH